MYIPRQLTHLAGLFLACPAACHSRMSIHRKRQLLKRMQRRQCEFHGIFCAMALAVRRWQIRIINISGLSAEGQSAIPHHRTRRPAGCRRVASTPAVTVRLHRHASVYLNADAWCRAGGRFQWTQFKCVLPATCHGWTLRIKWLHRPALAQVSPCQQCLTHVGFHQSSA